MDESTFGVQFEIRDSKLDGRLRIVAAHRPPLLELIESKFFKRPHPEQLSAYERAGFMDVIPEGETAQERTNRSARVLTEIASRHPEQTVVVITHGGFLTGFLGFVLGIPFANGTRFRKQNASFNAFEYLEPNWYLQTWNDASHLEGDCGL